MAPPAVRMVPRKPPKRTTKGSNKAKLPDHLQELVLQAYFRLLEERGAADVRYAIRGLPPIAYVCKSWHSHVQHEFTNWVSYDLRELVQTTNRFGQTVSDKIDLRRIEYNLDMSKCDGCRTKRRGALNLTFDGVSTESGKNIAICQNFPYIKKLLVASKYAGDQPVEFYLRSFPENISATLVRLDLSGVRIRKWHLNLPAVRTLTLMSVTFEPDEDDPYFEPHDEYGRTFFDSFENLRSFGIEGVKNLEPWTLSGLRMFSVTRLFLGDPTEREGCYMDDFDSDPVIPIINRYFRCKIRHLVLSPRQDGVTLLEQVLEGRTGVEDGGRPEGPPLFLKHLETVTLSPPAGVAPQPGDVSGVHTIQNWVRIREAEAYELLEDAGLSHVKIRWDTKNKGKDLWEPIESG